MQYSLEVPKKCIPIQMSTFAWGVVWNSPWIPLEAFPGCYIWFSLKMLKSMHDFCFFFLTFWWLESHNRNIFWLWTCWSCSQFFFPDGKCILANVVSSASNIVTVQKFMECNSFKDFLEIAETTELRVEKVGAVGDFLNGLIVIREQKFSFCLAIQIFERSLCHFRKYLKIQ